ncbi:hypothetical protein ES703_31551 [subsurface metagenome]
MKKIKSIDNHKIRIKTQENNTPIIEFIFQKLEKLSKKRYTLFVVCPKSENVFIAALRAAN